MADLDRINIFDYKAPTPEELLRAGGSGSRIEPTMPTPVRDYLMYDVLNPSGRQLFGFAQQELQNPLNYLGVSPPARAAAEVAKKGIQSLPRTKDLVFVHNTSEEAIKSFDAMGGIPSPSIAVTKADQPFTGFGNIQLIGKPEKFDPAVNPANKVYSADAYTPRAPEKIRFAKDDAVEQLKKDYKEFIDEGRAGGLEPLGIENLEKLKKGRGAQILNEGSLGFDAFFHNTNIAPEKFLKEIGRDTKNWQEKAFPQKRYNEWVRKQKDKYLSQDGVFTYFDEIDQRMNTMPYTLDNVVDNMVRETQRGGESLGTEFGANRLKAVMAEQFKDLPDIRARKEMIQEDEGVYDLLSDIENILDDATDHANFDYANKTLPIHRTDVLLEHVGEELKRGRKDVESIVNEFVENLEIPKEKLTEVTNSIGTALRLNAMRPVKYFEAKPTRAVGFDEFAGAIVPENTSKEVIDILKKRGLKVVKQKFDDIDTDYGKGKIRQQFQDQFFSIGLPAAGASALGIQNTDIFQDDTE